MKPTLKAQGTKRFKLKFDILLSNLALKFNLRRYNQGEAVTGGTRYIVAGFVVGRCRLTL
jgi:hypothetical protein